VPIGRDAHAFDGFRSRVNTSMTINATAMWLLGMYLALADEQQSHDRLAGTTRTTS